MPETSFVLTLQAEKNVLAKRRQGIGVNRGGGPWEGIKPYCRVIVHTPEYVCEP